MRLVLQLWRLLRSSHGRRCPCGVVRAALSNESLQRAASLLTPKFGILLCFTLLLGLSGGYSSSLASPLLAAPHSRPGGFLGPCPAAPCFLGTNQPRIAALPRPRS